MEELWGRFSWWASRPEHTAALWVSAIVIGYILTLTQQPAFRRAVVKSPKTAHKSFKRARLFFMEAELHELTKLHENTYELLLWALMRLSTVVPYLIVGWLCDLVRTVFFGHPLTLKAFPFSTFTFALPFGSLIAVLWFMYRRINQLASYRYKRRTEYLEGQISLFKKKLGIEA